MAHLGGDFPQRFAPSRLIPQTAILIGNPLVFFELVAESRQPSDALFLERQAAIERTVQPFGAQALDINRIGRTIITSRRFGDGWPSLLREPVADKSPIIISRQPLQEGRLLFVGEFLFCHLSKMVKHWPIRLEQ